MMLCWILCINSSKAMLYPSPPCSVLQAALTGFMNIIYFSFPRASSWIWSMGGSGPWKKEREKDITLDPLWPDHGWLTASFIHKPKLLSGGNLLKLQLSLACINYSMPLAIRPSSSNGCLLLLGPGYCILHHRFS